VFAAVALAVKPTKGDYVGTTSQGKPVGVKVNDKGRVKQFRAEFVAGCDNGGSWAGSVIRTDTDKHKISQKTLGNFSGKGSKTEYVNGGHYKGVTKYDFQGTFDTPTSASGKFHAKVKVIARATGQTLYKCHKTVQWHVP
jgi:hypothetical protein